MPSEKKQLIGLIILTMAIVHFLPKFTKTIPAPLAAIAVCTLLVTYTPLESKLVSEVVKGQRWSMTEKEIITEKHTFCMRDFIFMIHLTLNF